jgi:NTE family protein
MFSGTPASPPARNRFARPLFALALIAGLVVGCAHAPRNAPLVRRDPEAGYRFQTAHGQPDGTGLMVALFFSGGGSRAAAFSYGVLRELAATRLPNDRRMLDEVTTINAVSGGTFTAAYYCLYGDRIFTDYEGLFLKRDIQGTMLRRWMEPANSVRLLSSCFGRSDLAAEYYDELLFHGATYGDLVKATAPRPFLVINATNISTNTTVQFTQDQFDLIGSDLSRYPVSRAVAASSAVPLLFTPITLKNYADRVPAADPYLPLPAGGADVFASYRAELTDNSLSYRDAAKQPYVHLMDGGLADNLSLRNLLDAVTLAGGWDSVMDRLRRRGVTKLAVIVVNAAVEARQDWSHHEETPGMTSVIAALSNSAINRATRETVTLFEDSLNIWQIQRAKQRSGTGDQPKIYFIAVDFHGSKDPAERAFFGSVPTSLSLPAATTDRLIWGGERLLRESPAYQSLLMDLAMDQPAGPALPAKPR